MNIEPPADATPFPTGPWDETTHILSLEELAEAFHADRVLIQYRENIAERSEKIADFEKREFEFKGRVEKILDEEADLAARLKDLDRRKRETRGQITVCKYQISLNETRIKQIEKRALYRRKAVWDREVNTRLRAIGKGIKYGTGYKGTGGINIVPLEEMRGRR